MGIAERYVPVVLLGVVVGYRAASRDHTRRSLLRELGTRYARVELDHLEVLQCGSEGLGRSGVRQERADAAREPDRVQIDADLVELVRVDQGLRYTRRVPTAPAAAADWRLD